MLEEPETQNFQQKQTRKAPRKSQSFWPKDREGDIPVGQKGFDSTRAPTQPNATTPPPRPTPSCCQCSLSGERGHPPCPPALGIFEDPEKCSLPR